MLEAEDKFRPVKWLMGIVSAIIVIATTVFFTTVTTNSKDIAKTTTDIRVLETKQSNIKEALNEIKDDVKEILKKMERRERRSNG